MNHDTTSNLGVVGSKLKEIFGVLVLFFHLATMTVRSVFI